MTTKIKSVLYSVVSGLFLVIFWIFINQMRSQSLTQISEITEHQNQNNASLYKDGEYQANSPTPWGDVGIDLTVKNGRWTNVHYLQIPDSDPSQYAGNILARQALETQGASIDGVSGATYVSEAFRDDLSQIVLQSQT